MTPWEAKDVKTVNFQLSRESLVLFHELKSRTLSRKTCLLVLAALCFQLSNVTDFPSTSRDLGRTRARENCRRSVRQDKQRGDRLTVVVLRSPL
eukprot:766570-Hanusia_phi.AAC.6